MKKTLFIILLILGFFAFSQEEENWRVIPSVTEWIKEINNWPEDE